jgi:predicted RNA binding protein YcfA (HicA-like mRNA interferase family)
VKIPRNITGQDLLKLLKPLGYIVVRQSGSHIRIRTEMNGGHSETIPDHYPLKIGTLNKILNNIAWHFKMTKEELLNKILDQT